MSISRRQFILRSLTLGGTAALLGNGAVTADTTQYLEAVELEIPVAQLPADLVGYRIGFLTDLHLGVAIDSDFIAEAFASVVERGVDLLLLGGDYIWIAESPMGRLLQPARSPKFASFRSDIARSDAIFATLAGMIPRQKVPDGVFAIFGNHDRWVHPTACATSFARSPARLLLNEWVEVSRGSSSLLILGTDDYLTGVPRTPEVRRQRPGATVLLTHNPDYVSFLSGNERLNPFDLALCGHTHGGQVRVPFIGAPVYNIRDRRFGAGLVREQQTWVYTSRGLGVVEFPYRIACRPEATVLTLVSS